MPPELHVTPTREGLEMIAGLRCFMCGDLIVPTREHACPPGGSEFKGLAAIIGS